jgi:hypothetical protein
MLHVCKHHCTTRKEQTDTLTVSYTHTYTHKNKKNPQPNNHQPCWTRLAISSSTSALLPHDATISTKLSTSSPASGIASRPPARSHAANLSCSSLESSPGPRTSPSAATTTSQVSWSPAHPKLPAAMLASTANAAAAACTRSPVRRPTAKRASLEAAAGGAGAALCTSRDAAYCCKQSSRNSSVGVDAGCCCRRCFEASSRQAAKSSEALAQWPFVKVSIAAAWRRFKAGDSCSPAAVVVVGTAFATGRDG